MKKPVILFGGTSNERRVSVASTQHLNTILPEASLWFWTTAGSILEVYTEELQNHKNPFDEDFSPKHSRSISHTVDGALDLAKESIFYLGLHGGQGEDGWIQRKLEARKLPFTGSSSTSSELCMNKSESKKKLAPLGVKTAEQLLFSFAQVDVAPKLLEFQKKFGHIVLKPANDGSSSGLNFIKETSECTQWIAQNQGSKESWLAEEFIEGRELTIGVITHRGCLTVLPPSEVILERNARFDYQAKYHGVGNREITPAELTSTQRVAAQSISILAHTTLGCSGYTRTDMILTPRGIYYLETNTLPGMTRASFIPQQLHAAGINLKDFVHGQIELADSRYD